MLFHAVVVFSLDYYFLIKSILEHCDQRTLKYFAVELLQAVLFLLEPFLLNFQNKISRKFKTILAQLCIIGRLTGEFCCWAEAAGSALFSLEPFLACCCAVAGLVLLAVPVWPFSDDTLLASLSDKAPPKTVRTLWGRFEGSRLILGTPALLPFHQVDGPGPDSRPLVRGKISAWYSR